jgi:plastocyanin
MKSRISAAIVGLLCSLIAARAGSLSVTVTDSKGATVSDAVVSAAPINGTKSGARSRSGVIDQVNQQFVPYVSAIQVGTAVTFPNHDNIRHHVYSFSPAKKFELPLYAGIPAAPVVFDREGVVTLGCNIHDWMLAYVVVLATPHFQITRDEGRVSLKNLPAGSYKVEVWQPRMKAASDALAQTVAVAGAEDSAIAFKLDLKSEWRSKKTPALNPEDYR